MWDCPHCGCMNIAPSVPFCPMCFVTRDVATEPGQPVEDEGGSPVGSKTSDSNLPPSGDASTVASSPPNTSSSNDSDWGKE